MMSQLQDGATSSPRTTLQISVKYALVSATAYPSIDLERIDSKHACTLQLYVVSIGIRDAPSYTWLGT